MASNYSTRIAVLPQDRDGILALWAGNLGDPARMAWKFEWFYERSPTGAPIALLLTCSDGTSEPPELAGVAAAGRRSFLAGNTPVDASVLVDMTVHPQHRTLFPALLLQKQMLATGLKASPLLYGFPNAKAAPVFQRAGYRRLGTIKRYTRVLRSSRYLYKYLPEIVADAVGPIADLASHMLLALRAPGNGSLRLRWSEVFDIELTGNERAGDTSLIRGRRDAEFLRWRFTENGPARYHFISVQLTADGAHQGYWIGESKEGVLMVRDCSPALLVGRRAQQAWRQLFAMARSHGFSSLSFECFGPQDFIRTLAALNMPARGERPVFAAVRGDLEGSVSTLSWYLTAADEDE
ncbi:MAG: hypothetical protein ABI859_00455 [Pseudomonadota bacterium]